MQTIKTIRRSIKSAEDLRDIVKTMRTLSAVNIHHFEQAVESTGDYYRSVEMGFQVVLSGETVAALEQKEESRCGLSDLTPEEIKIVEGSSNTKI